MSTHWLIVKRPILETNMDNPHEANFNLLRDQITRYVGYIDGWVDRWQCDEETEGAIRDALLVIEQASKKAKFTQPVQGG